MTRVAACQISLNIENPAGNISHANQAISEAISQGAQIIVLPELTNSGYAFTSVSEVQERSTTLDGEIITHWKEIAQKSDVVIVAGLALSVESRLYNASVIIDKTGLLGWYAKVHLFGEEHQFFKSGDKSPLVVNTAHGRIATMVCYDVEFPEWVRLAMLERAALLAVPTNWPNLGQLIHGTPMEAVRVQAAASVNKMVAVAADRSGSERGHSWVSSSVITDYEGNISAIAHRDSQEDVQVLVADVELPTDTSITPKNDVRKDRQPDLYKGILKY
ncbi:MAG: nitrilase-related carbon-nitrogen hydrolase [Candidatus Planktophila sp.]|jgi:predicted amidohydrolase